MLQIDLVRNVPFCGSFLLSTQLKQNTAWAFWLWAFLGLNEKKKKPQENIYFL